MTMQRRRARLRHRPADHTGHSELLHRHRGKDSRFTFWYLTPRLSSRLPRARGQMSKTATIQIRMGGYGPSTTSFSKSLKFIGDRLAAEFGDMVDIKYVWNIMEFGYRSEDILWLVESGVLSLGYQSSSYLTDRVPELGFVDLPFLFTRRDQARAAMDGTLGQFLASKIEER